MRSFSVTANACHKYSHPTAREARLPARTSHAPGGARRETDDREPSGSFSFVCAESLIAFLALALVGTSCTRWRLASQKCDGRGAGEARAGVPEDFVVLVRLDGRLLLHASPRRCRGVLRASGGHGLLLVLPLPPLGADCDSLQL